MKEDEYMPSNLVNCFLCPKNPDQRPTKAKGPRKRPCNKYFEKYSQFLSHFKRNHPGFYENRKTLFGTVEESVEFYDDSAKEAIARKELVQLPGDSRYHCTTCSKAFPAAKAAIWHIRSDHGLAQLEKNTRLCTICNNQVTSRNWSQHVLRHKQASDEKMTCEVCNAQYARSDKLIEHKRARHPEVYRVQNEEYWGVFGRLGFVFEFNLKFMKGHPFDTYTFLILAEIWTNR